MDTTPLGPTAFRSPAVLLSGPVDYDMYKDFRRQFSTAGDREIVVVEHGSHAFTVAGHPSDPAG